MTTGRRQRIACSGLRWGSPWSMPESKPQHDLHIWSLSGERVALSAHVVLKEIAHFFATYKQIQKKEVVVGDYEGREAAEAAFARARQMYDAKK